MCSGAVRWQRPGLAAVVLASAGFLHPRSGAADATLQFPARGARQMASPPGGPVPAKGGTGTDDELRRHPRFTRDVERFVENFKPGGHDLTGQITLLSPEESLKRLHLRRGLVRLPPQPSQSEGHLG